MPIRKRHTIYKLLLQHMTDEQKLNITAKLCQDVLGAVVDGIMPLEADSDVSVHSNMGLFE